MPPEMLGRPCSLGGVSGIDMEGRLETAWGVASGDLSSPRTHTPSSLELMTETIRVAPPRPPS